MSKNKHPLDVPEGTVFNNLLCAQKPNPEVFKEMIKRLEKMLEDNQPKSRVRVKIGT